jgi:hypothetical protein
VSTAEIMVSKKIHYPPEKYGDFIVMRSPKPMHVINRNVGGDC